MVRIRRTENLWLATMSSIEELLNHCRTLREWMLSDIRAMKAAQRETYELRNGQRIDTTAESIVAQQKRANALSTVIATYEKKKA